MRSLLPGSGRFGTLPGGDLHALRRDDVGRNPTVSNEVLIYPPKADLVSTPGMVETPRLQATQRFSMSPCGTRANPRLKSGGLIGHDGRFQSSSGGRVQSNSIRRARESPGLKPGVDQLVGPALPGGRGWAEFPSRRLYRLRVSHPQRGAGWSKLGDDSQ